MTINSTNPSPTSHRRQFLYTALLIIIFLAAASFRLVGLFWGEYTYVHPDERFLIWVGTDISPITCEIPDLPLSACPEDQRRWMSFGEYLDSANSGLNPQNRGHSFYVYGNLPMTMTRIMVQWIYGHTGFDEMTNVGRALSALADMLTVLLVYLIGKRLYDRRVGLLASAFMAVTVLHIQQSHFFTADTFITFFTILAFLFAVMVSVERREWRSLKNFTTHPLFLPCILFGIALGMAMASKLNAFLMAGMLPAAMLIRLTQVPAEQRKRRGLEALVFLAMAGFIAFLSFRIFQPYAFTGPTLWNINLNPEWLQSIKSLYGQQRNMDVDFPPALQWARRPLWFSGQNLIIWGLGFPLGILAWCGFFWAGWKMLTSFGKNQEWQNHALIWLWTAAYFGYQSLAPNPTMRYQMPVYPTLVIFAAWAVITLWDYGRHKFDLKGKILAWNFRASALVLGGLVLITTVAWAYAFTRIYVRPVTRVEGTRWILNNIPGPINLPIQTSEGVYNQPLPFPYGNNIQANLPYEAQFQPKKDGVLTEIYLPHIRDVNEDSVLQTLEVSLTTNGPSGKEILATGSLQENFTASSDPRGEAYTLKFDTPVELDKNRSYQLAFHLAPSKSYPAFSAEMALKIQTSADDIFVQPMVSPVEISPSQAYDEIFTAAASGKIGQISLSNIEGIDPAELPKLKLTFFPINQEVIPASYALIPAGTGESGEQLFDLSEPVTIEKDSMYQIRLSGPQSDGRVALTGATVSNEGDWDEGLPLRMDGYDPFGGIYPTDMELQMVWEDTPEKIDRLSTVLDATDYIAFSSNRRWGTNPLMPERYPLTTRFYRELLGCPPEKDLIWCYRVAKPGKFDGKIGFDLVEVFQSDPALGPITINDQFAEEAFTVYDHPKVMIFKKNAEYDSSQTRAMLESVDLTSIIRKPPLRYENHPEDLLLPLDRLTQQLKGGTWSELFNTNGWLNRYPVLGVVAWYLSTFLLGLLVYPIVRYALPGLPDRGYPLARTAGFLLLSYLVWLAGSYKIPFTRPTIAVAFLLLAIIGGLFAYRQRDELRLEWKTRRNYFLMIEGLFLAFFLFDLFIRIGNPDLWHPYKGGEKPMDFAYLNAVLKSTSFPPFDPWYAGGYLNYYYYGFLLFGVLVKWLGIVPAIAYNLIIPTIFALIAVGAFSVAWNLYTSASSNYSRLNQFLSGLAGAIGMAVLGNLGTVRMIWQGFQKMAAPNGIIEGANSLARLGWGLRGLVQAFSGNSLPYSLGDWYWIPSRAIPPLGDIEPITEFPFFTVLYADLHAHLFALPLTLLALSFAISVIIAKGRWPDWLSVSASFILGGLAIGSLRPTNTWDLPTFLAIAVVALGYSLGSHYQPSATLVERIPGIKSLPLSLVRAIVAIGAMLLLIILSFVLFAPFSAWYALGYSKVILWGGPRTPISAYLVHWGLFLFLIFSWMIWETREWMRTTPVSALRKIQPYAGLIAGLVGLLLILTMFLAFKLPGMEKLPFGKGIQVAWLALPAAAWAAILLIHPNQSDVRRFIFFLLGTGFVLTLMVEIIVLAGDIGRMNTVFKFYLQVWTIFSLCAAACLGWILDHISSWSVNWRRIWQISFGVLVFGAALYPLTAGTAKVKDRMVEAAPKGLDGLKFIQSATYDWKGPMDLSQDYGAIRWMQENIPGSSVIAEANLRDLYRWGSRFSIYTGLPAVAGWEWHQQQQRAINPGIWVSNRINETEDFYKTTNLTTAVNFLKKYGVKFFVVGQLERNIYPALSLKKFEEANGVLWNDVYHDRDTVIYQVTGE